VRALRDEQAPDDDKDRRHDREAYIIRQRQVRSFDKVAQPNACRELYEGLEARRISTRGRIEVAMLSEDHPYARWLVTAPARFRPRRQMTGVGKLGRTSAHRHEKMIISRWNPLAPIAVRQTAEGRGPQDAPQGGCGNQPLSDAFRWKWIAISGRATPVMNRPCPRRTCPRGEAQIRTCMAVMACRNAVRQARRAARRCIVHQSTATAV